MTQALAFGEVVEAADRLTFEEQEELVAILKRRLIEQGHQRVLADIKEANREFAGGECRAVTPEELMREILS